MALAVEKVVAWRAIIFVFFLGCLAGFVRAQEAPTSKPLRVAICGSEPFVSEEDGTFQGFSIDVWQQIAAKNSWGFAYKYYPSPDEGIKAIENGEADVLVGDVSIVSDLFDNVEFSQPYFRAGLQIMITEGRPYTLNRMLEDMDAWTHYSPFWIFMGAVVIFSVLVALFERKHNPDFPKKWADGLAEALYYVVSLSLGKSGYKGFGGWFGRLVMIVWTVVGVFVVIIITSRVTAAMTTESLNSSIKGPQSLPGKTVGAVTGTRALTYLKHKGITFNEYPSFDVAVPKLIKGDVSALVGPAPILQAFDKDHPTLPITEIGAIFEHYNYGFAMPLGSPLRVPLNSALLDLQESGVLTEIGQRYFGQAFQL